MPDPLWNTPARLNGLRPKRWKDRSGVTRSGTLAGMLETWLSLPGHQRRDCSLGWGPDEKGRYGNMSADTLARYAERNGLPPQMRPLYQNPEVALARMLNVSAPDFRPLAKEHFADGASQCQARKGDHG